LTTAEQELRRLVQLDEQHRADARARAQRAADLRMRLAAADERSGFWEHLHNAIRRLAFTNAPLANRADVMALRDRFTQELHELAAQQKQLEVQRQALQDQARGIEHSGQHLDPELLQLADELGAELLANRFEDLDVAQASWVEARLGPLTQALIVDDLDVAATALEKRNASTVYLVQAGAVLDLDPPEELGDITDVRSPEPFGLRVTRRVPRPSLGRRARERQLQDILQSIERDGVALDDVASKIALVTSYRRELELVERYVHLLDELNPGVEQDQLSSELAALEQSGSDTDDYSTTAARTRVDDLRRLLPDLALLRGHDYAARATEIAAIQTSLAEDASELARTAPARTVLAELIDTLRSPPPSEAELARGAERAAQLSARLDLYAAARSALADVLVHRHAAGYTDVDGSLDARAHLAPALEAQVAAARADVQAAADSEATAEAAWETATHELQAAEATRLAALAHRDRVAAELAGFGPIADDAARIDVDALSRRVTTLDAEARELVGERAVTAERFGRSAQEIEDATEQLASAER
ncbi:MAG TPA: hypothetical protein VGC41_19825, partial [Kofleriaceae bacterium]